VISEPSGFTLKPSRTSRNHCVIFHIIHFGEGAALPDRFLMSVASSCRVDNTISFTSYLAVYDELFLISSFDILAKNKKIRLQEVNNGQNINTSK
jgi:hypothetical protein